MPIFSFLPSQHGPHAGSSQISLLHTEKWGHHVKIWKEPGDKAIVCSFLYRVHAVHGIHFKI